MSRDTVAGDWRPRWYAHRYNRAELYRIAAATSWLPRSVRVRIAGALGRVAAYLMPAERAAASRALAIITGKSGGALRALTRDLFAEYAMCFSDLISTNRRQADELLGSVRVPPAALLGDGDRGAMVCVTAHVGNWDMAGRLLARVSERPTHVVVAVEEARGVERWVRRDGDGVRFVARAHPTVSLTLMAALRRGEVVAMQGDRALGNRHDVMVPFFGRPAPFPIGPFRLASAARVGVFSAFCTLATDRRYDVVASQPLVMPPGSEEDTLRGWVGQLEAIVRDRPTQWFNFFDVWNPFAI